MTKRINPNGPNGSQPATRPIKPPPRGVTVRMYRLGLGDCFLLAFHGDHRRTVHMLIDCGVHTAQKGRGERIRQVLKDLHEVTGGHLDVVAVTHEHSDHLSGFLLMDQLFDAKSQFKIDQLWLGWTESREDNLASALRTRRGHTKAALRAALKRLQQKHEEARQKNPSLEEDPSLKRLAGLTQFFALSDNEHELDGDPKTVASPELTLEWLRKQARETVICYPGPPVLHIDGVPGVRVYVLGPPHNADAMGVDEPPAGGSEIYLSDFKPDASMAFAAAAINVLTPDAMREENEALRDLTCPFDPALGKELKTGRVDDPWLVTHYASPADEWRLIDDEWLHAAEGLALWLDSHTNNTSLALAIELEESGDVLFFVGDAQFGNWNSWKDLQWRVEGKTVRMEDLLERAIFYKVGHHASHNGTLRENGLERMGEDLIAMIPVDQSAASQLEGWKMPHEPLYERLIQKTGGRLFRSDQDCGLLIDGARKPVALSGPQWKAFQKAVQTPLYFQFTFPDGA